MQAGTHRIQWNGTDAEGNPAASGIYFYRLQSKTYDATRKMILLQ
jgi:flagellar hook assembly protein FlgD